MPDTNDCNRTGICPAEARAGRIPTRGEAGRAEYRPGGGWSGRVPARRRLARRRCAGSRPVKSIHANASNSPPTRRRPARMTRRVVGCGHWGATADEWLPWAGGVVPAMVAGCAVLHGPALRGVDELLRAGPPPAVGPGRLDAKGAREAWLVSRIGASPCGGVGRWSTDLSTSWLNRQPSEQIPYGPPDDHSVKQCSCHRKHGGAQISATFHVKHGNGRRRPRPSWVLWPTHENALFSPCGSHGSGRRSWILLS